MCRTRYAFLFMLAIVGLACGVAVPSLGWAQSEVPEIVVDGEPVLLAGVADDRHPTYSPDGSKIAFESRPFVDRQDIIDNPADIYVMNADGTNPINLTRSPLVDDEAPSWSPDGSKIAFFSELSIHVMNADGTNLIDTSQYTYDEDHHLAWSPDGSKIAFACEEDLTAGGTRAPEDPPSEICVINADGTNRVRLTHNSLEDSYPAWSPDGSKIAFTRHRPLATRNIYVMNADGTNPVRLTKVTPGHFAIEPRWSPDGSKIAFVTNSYVETWHHFTVVVMNADGTNPVLLTRVLGLGPTWSPDGSKIAFYRRCYECDSGVPDHGPGKIYVHEFHRGRGSHRATLLNLSPWQAWVHLYCLNNRPGPDANPPAPCAVTFECNGQSGEPVTWPVEVAPKTIFTYWPNKTATDGTAADLQAALIAAGKPPEEARRRTTCEVSSADPIAVRGYTRFNGQPTLVPVPAYPLSR